MSHFKLITSTKASDIIPVNKYVSSKTGITVIIAEVEGPIVDGYFSLATEANDDDGLPHTLEHLIFLGSKRYPYKGILDLAANRCMAQGTNAWTDIDHTCYTVSTAGDEGMLTLLPIYLDHILFPTLTEHGFITEVHHVDGDGDDAGVVYCEMQGRENNAVSRCELQLQRAMYPDSGYSFETGGIMENLRISTDNTKVRDFHKKFYRPENLTVILAGQIKANDVFKALSTVEDDIIAQRAKEEPETWVKPWTVVPPTPDYGEIKVEWPADTVDCGQIIFGWRGPLLPEPSSQKELTAVAVLLRYLCETASAPLQLRLVEREDALAGDISYNIRENIATCVTIELENVPVDKLQQAKDEALSCLTSLREGRETIDMQRIGRLIKKYLRESLAMLDSDSQSAIAMRCIADAFYSQNEQDFIARLNPEVIIRHLKNEKAEFWLELLKKYITDDFVCIVGSPSIDLQTRMALEDKERVDKQKETLGKKGLELKAKQLQEAIEYNERDPPAGTLAAIPIPSCTSLKSHNLKSWSTDSEPCPHIDLKELPLYARIDSLKTNFVYIHLIFDTSALDNETRKWIPLYKVALAECPVRRGSSLIPHQDIISMKENITISFALKIGAGSSGNFCVGDFSNFLFLETRCEPEDYEDLINFLHEILFAAELTKERLLVCTQRLINEVAPMRRKGGKMVTDALRDSVFAKDSNVHCCSLLRQQNFLKVLLDKINASDDSANAAIAEATAAFKKISQSFWVHLVTDFDRYKLSTEPWKKFDVQNEVIPRTPTLYSDASLLSNWGNGFVVGIGGEESSHLRQYSPGPRGHELSDVAPLTVALNYFTQLEGPMWRLIRGCGLSYGYRLQQYNDIGCIVFALSRATNAIGAYNKTKSILEEYLADPKFDDDLFASAKSASIHEAVVSEKSPAYVVDQSLLNYLRQVPSQYTKSLVCAISAVTPESAHAAAARWLPALFDSAKGKLGIACQPSKVNAMQIAFEKINNLKLEAFESMEASHMNK